MPATKLQKNKQMEPVFECKVNESYSMVSVTIKYKENEVPKEKELVFFKNTKDFLGQILQYCLMADAPIDLKQ